MSDLRKAAEMEMAKIYAAKHLLRQALAESANSTTSVAESKVPTQTEQVVSVEEYRRLQKLVTSQGVRLMEYESQPEQEPVGYVIRMTGQYHTGDFCGEFQSRTALKQGQVFYTAPPKREWKGLTSDDKHFLLANAWNKEQAFDGFMDAIDKFLEEKNT